MMRVLVTRPEPGGSRTAKRLEALGHEAVLLPLFVGRMSANLADLPARETIGGFVATSARVFSVFKDESADLDGFKSLPVYVVGRATAQAAREAGFIQIQHAGGTAQDLARLVISVHSDRSVLKTGACGGDLVYLAGEPRRVELEMMLDAAGLGYGTFECYKMTKISYSTDFLISKFLSQKPDIVLLYSVKAAERLIELFNGQELGKTFESARFLCLSEAIAAVLPLTWQKRILIATKPDEESLLASLAVLG